MEKSLSTIEERMKHLESSNELHLAIEGRYTNLRIFIGHNGNGHLPIDSVFMRLDKANEYSTPLNEKSINYLYKEHNEINELLEKFGFVSSISNLPEILRITEKMNFRQCVAW